MNDSSALAAAVVGVAMGSGGCGMAVAAAGVVILSDNLLLVRPTLRIAILARQVLLQNCVFAVAVKVMAIVLAILGRLGRPSFFGRSFTLLYIYKYIYIYVCVCLCMYVCVCFTGRSTAAVGGCGGGHRVAGGGGLQRTAPPALRLHRGLSSSRGC